MKVELDAAEAKARDAIAERLEAERLAQGAPPAAAGASCRTRGWWRRGRS